MSATQPSEQGGQLELFALQRAAAPRPLLPRFFRAQVRYDQLMIGGIAALIGLAVVFALGVERGKQLVRGERTLLACAPAASQAPAERSVPAAKAPVQLPAMTKSIPTTSGSSVPEAPTIIAPPAVSQPSPAAPKPRLAEGARYAVQIVTYSTSQLAQRELSRLQQDGERAFLLKRDGHTIVYVGPFDSKTVARDKASSLKERYKDCFLKSL